MSQNLRAIARISAPTCNRETEGTLSPRLPRLRESKRHLFVVDSLDKHMQNEKELIRLRRFMPAARTTRREPGARNFACGANYPHQALKGGYFLFVCGEY